MSLKEAYQKKMQAQLDEWKADIEVLKAKAKKAEAAAEIEYNKQFEKLVAKQEAAKARMQELAEAGEDKWEHLKDNIERSWNDLAESIKTVADKFKKQD